MDFIDLQARLLALFHRGGIKLNCATCKRADALNCAMDESVDIKYYNPNLEYTLPFCPVRVIGQNVTDWYDEHVYNTEYGTALSYNEADYFKWEFIKNYKRYYEEFGSKEDTPKESDGKIKGFRSEDG